MKGKQRINEQITASQVRLISESGEQLGILSRQEALNKANAAELDLVEVSSNGDVPVCRLMDYGKYRYQQSKRQHDAKKHQKQVQVKEVKLRTKTAEHDFNFKLKNTLRFLGDGNKVKVSVEFRGREMTHRELGGVVLQRFEEATAEHGSVEQRKDEGRSMFIILTPNK